MQSSTLDSTLGTDDASTNPLCEHTTHETPGDALESPEIGIPSPCPAAAATPANLMELKRRDVVRYRYSGRVQTGTVIRSSGERVWLKTGAATLEVPVGSIVSVVHS